MCVSFKDFLVFKTSNTKRKVINYNYASKISEMKSGKTYFLHKRIIIRTEEDFSFFLHTADTQKNHLKMIHIQFNMKRFFAQFYFIKNCL